MTALDRYFDLDDKCMLLRHQLAQCGTKDEYCIILKALHRAEALLLQCYESLDLYDQAYVYDVKHGIR